ncbi:DUF1653 domain-containing protein, partial [Nanoarchaeota archaeon]
MKIGRYKHFKGKEYEVLMLGKDSETLEDIVVYKALYDSDLGAVWVRPLKMFDEEIERDGKKMKR